MKKIIKVIALIFVVAIVLTSFSGCNLFGRKNDDTKTTTAASEATTGTPVTNPAIATTENLTVVDPALEHGTLPQTQIGHPNFYVESGTNATYKWKFEVKQGEIGIAGGTVVDGIGNGVLKVFDKPGVYTVTVQNGFVLTIISAWAQNELGFRYYETLRYKWDCNTIIAGSLIDPKTLK